jgi:hypothetical protein
LQCTGVRDGLRLAGERLGLGLHGFSNAIRKDGLSKGVKSLVANAPQALAAPLGGAIGAGKILFLGAQNALDPKRYESRRLADL